MARYCDQTILIRPGTDGALAREYARAKAPAILLGSGPFRYGNGGMTVRLITTLSACFCPDRFRGRDSHPQLICVRR